jgi:hypothetical protein
VNRGNPEVKILIADDGSFHRKRLRALLISTGFSHPILLVEQPRKPALRGSLTESYIDFLPTDPAIELRTTTNNSRRPL